MTNTIKIRPREKSAIIESLRAGVVPKIGIQHIQVGRKQEIEQIVKDFSIIEDGGAKVRFIIGEYGSGKTFFLTLSKLLAHQKNLVVVSADIASNRILSSGTTNKGKTRNLFSELINNMSTKTKPDGGALKNIIESWATNVLHQNSQPSESDVFRLLSPLENYANRDDFCKVVTYYLRAYDSDNEVLMGNTLRWLKAGYPTKTEAHKDLGVRSIIDDDNFYDYLKLFSGFVVLAGYKGLIVNLDELAVLGRLNPIPRKKNFELLLTIVNDSFQGQSKNLGFIFSGTPDFLEDKYKGMFSYGALESRLATNQFSRPGFVDYTGPVIRLDNLSKDALFVLFRNIRNVFAMGDSSKYLVTDVQISQFLNWVTDKLGANFYQTPRESIKAFVGLLSQLESYPQTSIDDYLSKQTLTLSDDEGDTSYDEEDSDGLIDFKL